MNLRSSARMLVPAVLVGALWSELGCGAAPRSVAEVATPTGEALYRSHCGQCHDLYPAHAYSDQQWSEVMADMMNEAELTKQEAEEVLRWLTSAN